MIIFAILMFLVVSSVANPLTYTPVAPKETTLLAPVAKILILRQINQVNDDGSYTFGYEASDGSFRVEHRDVTGYVIGKFGYIDTEGRLQVSGYLAGTDVDGRSLGFQTTEARPPPLLPGVRTISIVKSFSTTNTNPILNTRETEQIFESETSQIQPQAKIIEDTNSTDEQPKFFQFGQALFRSPSKEAAQTSTNTETLSPNREDRLIQNLGY